MNNNKLGDVNTRDRKAYVAPKLTVLGGDRTEGGTFALLQEATDINGASS